MMMMEKGGCWCCCCCCWSYKMMMMMMMIGVSLLFLSSLLRPKANSLNTGRESSHSSVRRFPRSTSHVNTQLHQAFHHYIKVISTHYEKQRMFGSGQRSCVAAELSIAFLSSSVRMRIRTASDPHQIRIRPL